MGAGERHAHEHGASAVDVQGELARTSRGLGLGLLVVGALLCSGGLWLLTRSRTAPSGEELQGGEREPAPSPADPGSGFSPPQH